MTKSTTKKGSVSHSFRKKDDLHKYQLRDFVFAKTVTHPPWPARIFKIKENHIYRVDFIGVKYYADIYVTELENFN